MIDEKRLDTTPTEHIYNLLKSVNDGKLTVTYYDVIEPPYKTTYDVSCTAENTDELVLKYESLIKAIEEISVAREKLDNGAKAEDIFTAEQLYVWNTYIRDFDELFDAGEYNLDELYDRKWCGDELNDEEQEVIERHYEWYEKQCLSRLPKKVHSPHFLLNRVRRYEYLLRMNAPESVIEEEGRCLAEEMILYHYCV